MGWLSKWFGRDRGVGTPQPDIAPLDLSAFRIDYHSHLVPGVDDGAADLDASLEMIQGLVDLGYEGAVTTPHVYPGMYPNSPDTLRPPFEMLKEAVSRKHPHFRLALGAEYFLDAGLLDALRNGSELLTPGKHLLFELPFVSPPPEDLLSEFLFEAQVMGLKPVMAHIERYPYWHNELHRFEEWAEQGVLLQVNAASLAGGHGREIQEAAEYCIQKGWVRILGSDAHGIRHIEALEAALRRPSLHLLNSMQLNSSMIPEF